MHFEKHPIGELYAETLLNIGTKHNLVDVFEQQVHSLTQVFLDRPKFRILLETPSISKDEKIGFLDQVLREVAHPLFLNFLKILVKKGRMVFFHHVVDSYTRQVDKLRGRERATVVTAVPMTDETRLYVVAKLREQLRAEVVLTEYVDSRLLGGISVLHEDEYMDGSIQNKIVRMRDSLLRSKVHEVSH
ncbi:MAG: ATP synthase F1 subunit delta [Planctomycetes bacterium]|nr:ATP synthase F1 subunit delta [Planctomycetota bacterium]